MNISRLFLFEIVSNDYRYLEKMVKNIRSKVGINLVCAVTESKLPKSLNNLFDRVYFNSSYNKSYHVMNNCNFLVDYYIRIFSGCDVDIEYIFKLTLKKLNDKLIATDDFLNIACRIYSQNLINNDLIEYSYSNFKSNLEVDKKILKSIKIDLKKINNNKKFSEKILFESNFRDLVTIIMTCYNSEKTVDYALKSIINQTYENKKIIIVDDASTDSTLKIIDDYADRYEFIKIIKNTTNQGTYYCKNVALNNLNQDTRYIAFQDSDDISFPSRIEKQYNLLKSKKLLMTTTLSIEKNIIKLPMISMMVSIIVFKYLGFFNTNRFGSDEEFYYRFFTVFVPDFIWNVSLKYEMCEGYFRKYKYYENIPEILYQIYRNEKSLTRTIKKPRSLLSSKLVKKYKDMKGDSKQLIKKCHQKFNYNFQNIIDKFTFPADQAYVSKSLDHIKKRFLKVFNLKNYYSNERPVLFFGMYNKDDLDQLISHKGKKYIIWGGTDIDLNYEHREKFVNLIKKSRVTGHFAISDDLEKRLKKLKFKSRRIEFNLVNRSIFQPVEKLGNKIYIYNGFNTGNEEIYGKEIYQSVINKLPNFQYIFSNQLNLSYEKMPNIYSQCFIGLRLTQHDGNANTVQEMSAMNIPIIHNGEDKNCIPWKNTDDVINIIKDKYKKKNIVIIFEKDLTLHDGSLIWLKNFLELFNDLDSLTLLCKNARENIFDKKIKIINIKNDINKILNSINYDKIYYRPGSHLIKFKDYRNLYLILHYFDITNIDYYNKFDKIFVNSQLIKNELEFNSINSRRIKILPPLIKEISSGNNKDNLINFIYSGTLKKEYQSLELLKLIYSLSKIYKFKFKLIYGKIKESDSEYDNKLKKVLMELEKEDFIKIYVKEKHHKIIDHIKNSHFGIVIHSEKVDNKQQSTKLIEYLSQGCIPICYFTFLNCGYINSDELYFHNIESLKKIFVKILEKKIRYDDIKINKSKLKEHLIFNNRHKLNNISPKTKIIITNKQVLKYNFNDIIISNNLKNKISGCILVYLSVDYDNLLKTGKIVKDFILGNKIDYKKIIRRDIEIFDSSNENTYTIFKNLLVFRYFNIKFHNEIFNFKYDENKIDLYGVTKSKNQYYFSNFEDYMELNFYFLKNKFYSIDFEIDTKDDGYLKFLAITYHEGKLIDINRNLHHVQKNNKSIQFVIKVPENYDYIIKIKPSARNFTKIKMEIKKLKIYELNTINKICDKVFIINMEKEIQKFYDLNKLLEDNYIKSERATGVNGYTNKIQNQFNEYSKEPFTDLENKIGRKLLASPGAFGYLYSMRDIFFKAITNRYEYIMICDDDIGLIQDFIYKFDNLTKQINKPRLLMLGSSQWEWTNIKINENFYYPNGSSNGSFCNIYHCSLFENILKKIMLFNSPFDCNPMKSNFKLGNCFISYPNLAIAQLEESSIQKKSNQRTYKRFKWDKINYNFPDSLHISKLSFRKMKARKTKYLFVIGITTYNRINYLKECVSSLESSLGEDIDYLLIFADGCSKDGTPEYIKSLKFKDNISHILISNPTHFIYRQTNCILKYCLKIKFNFGFVINDDLLFKFKGWDKQYYKASLDYNMDHLVFFDTKFKTADHTNHVGKLTSYCEAKNCQGALFTFTSKILDKVGFFDEKNFKIRGHSHVDFTLRCCRMKFNEMNNLFDIRHSNKYISLNNKQYTSSFNKLPFLLRELHKADIYELNRREEILKKDRRYINADFLISD